MHYRRGIDSIHDIMVGKMLRAQSLLESGSSPNFESLEDTYKDLINYASFAVSWLRYSMDGQNPFHDIFNRPKQDWPQADYELKSPGENPAKDEVIYVPAYDPVNDDKPEEVVVAKYRGKSLPEHITPMPEYVPIYTPYDPSAEHVNFTTTFNERYIGNQARGNVFV